jgi:hypothetical protein
MIQSRDFASEHATVSPQSRALDASFPDGISQDLAEIDRRLALMRAAIEPIQTGEMTGAPTDVRPHVPAPAAHGPNGAQVTALGSRKPRDPVLAAISMLLDHPSAAASSPKLAAVGCEIPSLSNVRPRSHVVSTGWLGDAVRTLAELDADATARVILALLPIQG